MSLTIMHLCLHTALSLITTAFFSLPLVLLWDAMLLTSAPLCLRCTYNSTRLVDCWVRRILVVVGWWQQQRHHQTLPLSWRLLQQSSAWYCCSAFGWSWKRCDCSATRCGGVKRSKCR
jgi:hypothetical protein